jgi:hypothetical protein
MRDDAMCQNGYLRATIVGRLLGVATSTVGKWPETATKSIAVGGLRWVNWSVVRAFRTIEADSLNLPHEANVALEYARAKGLV